MLSSLIELFGPRTLPSRIHSRISNCYECKFRHTANLAVCTVNLTVCANVATMLIVMRANTHEKTKTQRI
jgi:hypothetical protein